MSDKKREIIIVVVLIIAVAMAILPNYLNNLDEIWNFNFAKNMADGLLPYKDFNIIQGPLVPAVCSAFLVLFGTEIIVMRVLAILLGVSILFMVYKVMNLLNVQKIVTYLFMTMIYGLFFNDFRVDYNLATLLLVLIVLYYEIRKIKTGHGIVEYNFKSDFFLGVIIGTTILFKQTTGLFILAIFVLYKLLAIAGKEDVKKVFKIVLTRSLGALIPILAFVTYLTINNIWEDFLSYSIYGITTFSNHVPYIYLIREGNLFIKLLSILVPASIIYMCIKSIRSKNRSEQDQLFFIMLFYSVATFIFIYPIADQVHFAIGSIPSIIAIAYILAGLLNRIKERKLTNILKRSMEFVTYVVLFSIVIQGTIVSYEHFSNFKNTSNLSHYKYIRINDEGITKITDYILEQENEGKKVYILDASAAIYMIPINRYNKDYDMFLKGNLGSGGEQGQIEKLNKEDNAVLLIMREESNRNWQTPTEVIEYVTINWEKIGEIEHFDIYERK